MTCTKLLAASLALAVLVPLVRAQYPYSPYPYPYYNGGGGASTVGQSYAMGMADLVRAAGDNHLNNSKAAINYEQADSMDLDNQLKGTQTYFEMRKMNTAYRKAEEFKGLSTEDSWRVAQENMPKRLRSTQLDPVTGKIYWPILFQNPQYADYTGKLDQLFIQREAAHGGISYDVYTEIQKLTSQLAALLQKNINSYPAADYIQMKSFLESLAYEATLPAV